MPTDDVYNALLKHGWDWYGNKFSLFNFSEFYREEFPMQPSGYNLEFIPLETRGISIEKFPTINNEYSLETIPNTSINNSSYNPIPLSNEESQVLIIGSIVIVSIVAIVLIPSTGGTSLGLLFA